MTQAVQNLGLLDNPQLYMMPVQLCSAFGGIAYELAEALSGLRRELAERSNGHRGVYAVLGHHLPHQEPSKDKSL